MKCKVCGKDYLSLHAHLAKTADIQHLKYLESVISEIDNLAKDDKNYFAFEICDILKEKHTDIVKSLVYKRLKETDPDRKARIFQARRTGLNNPVFKDGVIEKITQSVINQWEDGAYDDRINGMSGKYAADNPNFELQTFLKWKYSDIYKFYHKEVMCLRKDCNSSPLNIHHIDKNEDNFLLTNLECFCVNHHMDHHYTARKPNHFCIITKKFNFDACHKLIDYIGKCARLHGHTYFLEVSIRKQVNPENGMIMDFGDLKKVVNDFILEVLDHDFINEKVPYNSTAENIVFWMWERLEKVALLKGLHEIKLYESPDSWCVVSQKDMFNSEMYLQSYYSDMVDICGWEKK